MGPLKSLFILFLGLVCSGEVMSAQVADFDSLGVGDSLYREDQFYLGFSYNLLVDKPDGVNSAAFSGGVELGFIRDFPLNSRRNLALGVGAGWSYDNFGSSLFIGEESDGETTIFRELQSEDVDYDVNRFSIQSIEVPIQLRWRTSTMESYSFWRVYLGVKLGYAFYYRSNFEQNANVVRQTDIPEFNRLRVGATLSFGYSTFNFHVYYGLNPLFNSEARLEDSSIGMGTLKVGLMFYLL